MPCSYSNPRMYKYLASTPCTTCTGNGAQPYKGIYSDVPNQLENEFEFAKSASDFISKRYGRPEDNVCISLDHSACMIMGGTFEGTYVVTITSVSMISPTVNKRNAALISDWLNKNLGVPANRGYIRFVDPDVANYAAGGVTILDVMEKEEVARTSTADRTGFHRDRSIKRNRSKKEQVSEKSMSPEPETDRSPSRLMRKSVFNLFSRSRS